MGVNDGRNFMFSPNTVKMAADSWKKILVPFQSVPELMFLSSDGTVELDEIGDGNLNNVYRLLSRNSDGEIIGSVIIKQSLPYLKCLGEGYPLGVERIGIENRGLHHFYDLSPGSVPKPLAYVAEHNAVCMEDLREYQVLRKMLVNREFNLDIARTLATHIGIVHRETHISKLGEENLRKLDEEFENSNLMALTERFFFNGPFTEGDETNRWSEALNDRVKEVYKDEEAKTAARTMCGLFKEKKECLVHGDLHTGSVMAKGGDAKMFDIEFAYVGPAAFDIGSLIANYLVSYYRHMSIEQENDKGRQFAQMMIETCKVTVETYLCHMTASIGDREEFVSNMMSEVAGFAGVELCRRLIGTAHNIDLEGVPFGEQDALGAGIRLLHAYKRIHTIDRLLVIALMLAY